MLTATSNPEARALQSAIVDDALAVGDHEHVAARVAHDVNQANIGAPGALGPVGVVVGATVDRAAYGLGDVALAGMPILAPGFGAQGADPADLRRLFGYVAKAVVANESRSVLAVGPARLADRIEARADLYREALHG